MNFPVIPKPPTKGDERENYRWQYLICEVLNGLRAIWLEHNKTQGLELADDTLPNPDGYKHVTNAQVKVYGDHVREINNNPHGTDWDMLEGTINHLPMNVVPVSVPGDIGTVSWNLEHQCLDVKTSPEVTLQVGQEDIVHVYNQSGVAIPNGSVVYINGAHLSHPTVALAKAIPGGFSNTLLITTSAIDNGAEGFCTSRGMLHGFNTSGYVSGDILYLSDSVLGGLTKTKPIPPNYVIPLATTLDSIVDGIIYVQIVAAGAITSITDLAVAAKDPTGFVDNANITLSYDSATQKITLTHPSKLQYYWQGSIKELGAAGSWTSSAHANTAGHQYFLSSADGINFTWAADTAWEFWYIQAAYVYYGATNKFALREVHGLMNWESHQEFHLQIGTYKKSGGSVAYTGTQPSVSATTVQDEDIQTIIPAITPGAVYTQLSLQGATGISTFDVGNSQIVHLGPNPMWNQWTGAAWQYTNMDNNSYMSIFLIAVPAGADAGSQVFRYIWVQGQANNATLSGEQAVSFSTLNLGQLSGIFTEFVPIARIIVNHTTGTTFLISQTDSLSGNKSSYVSVSGSWLSTVATDATLTGLGTTALPLSVAKLATGRTIAITGPITYTSPSFDGSSNVTAAATVTSQTGTGSKFVMDTSPTIITPNITTGLTIAGTTQLRGYKEDVWTPTPTNFTTVGTPTYTGRYTRIGRLVRIDMTIVPATSTASSYTSTDFTGLPYTVLQGTSGTVGNDQGQVLGLCDIITAGYIFTPTWPANGNTIWISFSYITGDAF